MRSILILMSFTLMTSVCIHAQSNATFNFDTPGELTAEFNQGGSASNITQSTNTGIGSSGAINITNSSTNEVFVTKQGYSNGGVGSVYSFSTFFKSVWNSGFGGIGFTSDANATHQSLAYATNSIGISVHGGGYFFNSGTTTSSGSWSSSINDLLNNGSPDDWYKVVFIVEQKAGNVFDLTCEVYPALSNGTLTDANSPAQPEAVETTSFTNPAMASASVIYSYFGFGGTRISDFDNYEIDLDGSSIIEEDAPVVVGSAVLGTNTVDLSGEVTDDRGSAVTDRGFVWSHLETEPTTANATVIQKGSGTGTFSHQITSPALNMYYIRSYATNANGTSYGETSSVDASTLPVELTNFEVRLSREDQAELHWTTASEINNKHFEIERSTDGRNYSTVGIVEGKGTTAIVNNYYYEDNSIPLDAQRIYYKLKQVDFDGAFEYSKTEVLKFENQLQFTVSPNPVEDILTMNYTIGKGKLTGEVIFQITHINGSVVSYEKVTLDSESGSHEFDMSQLVPGAYIFSMTSDAGQQTTRVIKR